MVESKNYRVYICCGINCGPKGSRLLVDFMEEEVERLDLGDRVTVYPGGCQAHCETGPTMVVFPGPVFYQEVDRQRITRIAREHFGDGQPVTEYLWLDPSKHGFNRARRPPIPNRSYQPPAGNSPANNSPRNKKPQKPAHRRSYDDVDDFKW